MPHPELGFGSPAGACGARLLSVVGSRIDLREPVEGGASLGETARQRSARRSKIIADVYAAWVAEHLAGNTLRAAVVGDVTSEEHAELAFLTAEADGELHRRTTTALRDAGFRTARSRSASVWLRRHARHAASRRGARTVACRLRACVLQSPAGVGAIVKAWARDLQLQSLSCVRGRQI